MIVVSLLLVRAAVKGMKVEVICMLFVISIVVMVWVIAAAIIRLVLIRVGEWVMLMMETMIIIITW